MLNNGNHGRSGGGGGHHHDPSILAVRENPNPMSSLFQSNDINSINQKNGFNMMANDLKMNKNIVKDNESGKSSTQNRNHLKEDHNNNINNNNNGNNDNKNVNNNHQKSNKQANNSNATTVITSTHATIPQLIQEKPPPVSEDENPLEHAYTFWFSQRGRGAKNKTSAGDFEQNIKFICTVSSVEQFWKAYSRIIQPNDLTGRCDIHLFKYGIRPMWEDEANKNGGKWQVRLKKGVATRCWENLILAMVGEQFACGDEICGAVVSVRYHTEDIVGVWNRTATNMSVITQIRDIFKRVLNLPSSSIMEYKEHYESIKDASNRQHFPHNGVNHHSDRHHPHNNNPRNDRSNNQRPSRGIQD